MVVISRLALMTSIVAGNGSVLKSKDISDEARWLVLDEKNERPTFRLLEEAYAVLTVPESTVVSRTPVGITTFPLTKLPYCIRYHASSASISPAITSGMWTVRALDQGPYMPSTNSRTSHTTDPMSPRSSCGV